MEVTSGSRSCAKLFGRRPAIQFYWRSFLRCSRSYLRDTLCAQRPQELVSGFGRPPGPSEGQIALYGPENASNGHSRRLAIPAFPFQKPLLPTFNNLAPSEPFREATKTISENVSHPFSKNAAFRENQQKYFLKPVSSIFQINGLFALDRHPPETFAWSRCMALPSDFVAQRIERAASRFALVRKIC